MSAAVAVIAAGLIMERAWRAALWWCLLFLGGMLLVVATKVAFLGWGLGIQSLDFAGISGHAMRAIGVIPVLCYLILQKTSMPARLAGVLLGIALGSVIAVSRVVLHFHSPAEIVAGSVLGIMMSLCFIWILANSRPFGLSRLLVAFTLIVALAAPLSASAPTPTQRWVTKLALYLSGRQVPYARAGWRYSRLDHGGIFNELFHKAVFGKENATLRSAGGMQCKAARATCGEPH